MDRLECKFASEGMDAKTGEFAGYGAIFGNIDSHGDVITPGAFADTLSDWGRKAALPAMKLMHGSTANPFTGSDLPIGVWKVMREDSKGLYVEGKLSGMETDGTKRIFSLMQDGALNGLSIGYKAVNPRRGTSGMVKRHLDKVLLSEVSLVPIGSNPEALVTNIKSQFQSLSNEDWRDIEAILRTKDLSRADAVKAVSGFKEWLQREAGENGRSPRDEDDAEVTALLRRNLSKLA